MNHEILNTTNSSQVLYLSDNDVTTLAPQIDIRTVLQTALRELEAGRISSPDRVAAKGENGFIGVMPGWSSTLGHGAKVLAIYPGAPVSHQGIMAYFDPNTGQLASLISAGALTSIRTAAMSSISIELLANSRAQAVVMGTGTQAQAHLQMLRHTDGVRQITVIGRNIARARALASRTNETALDWRTSTETIHQADIIICATGSSEPLLDIDDISSPAHVISVGSGPELGPMLVKERQVFVDWAGANSSPPPAGAAEFSNSTDYEATTLGSVLLGNSAAASGTITVYKSTGHISQDLAVAKALRSHAEKVQIGTWLEG